MRAVVTVAHGDRSQLQYRADYPDPAPAPDEVVLKIGATAVNYHDIFTRRGMPGIKIPLPVVVGSDIAGEVFALGSDAAGWSRGDRVLVNPIYRSALRQGLIGEVFDGGRAEFVSVAASQLIRIPANVSMEFAASLPLAYG